MDNLELRNLCFLNTGTYVPHLSGSVLTLWVLQHFYENTGGYPSREEPRYQQFTGRYCNMYMQLRNMV